MTALIRRAILVSALIAGATAAALAVEFWLSASPDRPFAHTRQGHAIGWVGLFSILLVLMYPFRKRHQPGSRWPRAWFRAHMVCGVLGPLLILVHAGAHLHAMVPVLALLTLGLVMVSGIVGQALHYLALRTANEERRELLHQGLDGEMLEKRLRGPAAWEEVLRLWQVFHGPATIVFLALTLLHIGGALYFGGF